MNYILANANAFIDGRFVKTNVFVSNGKIVNISPKLDSFSNGQNSFSGTLLDLKGRFLFPGLIDVHVHFREPGFFYKETIATGSEAAAAGGYTTVCTMPNLSPAPDTLAHLQEQLDIIEKDACIHVVPYGTITMEQKGEILSDMEEMAPFVAGFSDDGRGVQQNDMMRNAMVKAKFLHKIIAAHCEDNTLLHGGYIHDGAYAKAHGHKGISSASEYVQIQRDLKLAEETGCAYHVCHISTKESVACIREAKIRGVNVTCETGPHYLILCDEDLQEDGRFKMNPPLRSAEDRAALIAGIKDGTIDMIATDHAPHSAEEKAKGLAGSLMGIVGLETAFPLLYTHLVMPGIITLEKLMELMHTNPSNRFGLGSELAIGAPADLTVFNLTKEYRIDPEAFLTKGRSTPFAGEMVFGKCEMTMCKGVIVYGQKI